MIDVTRKYSFSASHRLHSGTLSDEQNRELFGKCNNPYGHGHNYELYVTVRGPVQVHTGQVIDRRQLDDFVQRTVLERVDQRDLNRDVPEFGGAQIPTTENVNIELFRWLDEGWAAEFGSGPRLQKVRIGETFRNIFEVSRSHV